ncbi:MEDS: MEthanogen/methylotroph, DcmR Sensory domain [Mariprofundus ferrinatatus]|uniref:MEDS: MEthanogen/methylotroph, DcmR Sensory domain n=1 Tax=Mariprofundus ferrinatatus TaxID=1921087 RepID=A0A2K8L3B6_9PROT|nr:MEDS domain-containing protein [Mariprofundus ferrinatatus]ATX81825.1 MEDS: MEthanogen/methylotroph, DcmR Sensory domain [Mariprofundus ferrinatatus]
MCSSELKVNLGFTSERFPPGTHMCLIYSNEEERRETISKFLDSGLKGGERVGYFADEMSPVEVKEWLGSYDLVLPDREESGQFICSNALEVYCPEGKFEPDDMIHTLKSSYQASCDDGYPGLRVSGEMSWALRGVPGSDRLMEYEAKVNIAFRTHPVIAICQYDARRFDGSTILDVLRVHPVMVVQGRVVHNPYFIQPEAFLASLSGA